MTASLPASTIRFGRVTVLPAQRRVLLDGAPAHIGARAFDVLHALLSHRGSVLSKKDLLRDVWGGVVVEENNLHVQVCALRKMLGATAIVTVPGRGYAFDAGIAVREAGDADAEPAPSSTQQPGMPMRGREGESQALAGLVGLHRVVTVAGPGGVGKTRLVRETLARMLPPPVTLELGCGAPRATLAGRIARALGLGFARPPGARDVARALRNAARVIVLENAELAIEQAAELAEALADAADVHLVCTAQAPLRCHGEHVFRLEALRLPDHDGAADAAESPAVELLFDAVSALRARERFTQQEVRDAAAICRHLDGLPLAIELAAAHVDVLGVGGVRRRLSKRFSMLEGAARGTAARQQSLLATLAWSWELLTPGERDALCSLSRFTGRFTLSMARRILGAGLADDWNGLQLLEALVNKSVVLAVPGTPGAFRVPESTRLYTQQRFREPRTATAR